MTSENPAQSLTLQVVAQLDHLLNTGVLVAGQRLVESDLCDRLGVGRVPVREALRILAGDGVIELVPGRGARVREMDPQQIADMLKVIVGYLFVGLDAFPAAMRDPATEERLLEHRNAIHEARESRDPFRLNEALCDFQSFIIGVSGNRYLIDRMSTVHFNFYTRQVLRFAGFREVYETSENYDEITAALVACDTERAKALFCETRDGIVAHLENFGGAETKWISR